MNRTATLAVVSLALTGLAGGCIVQPAQPPPNTADHRVAQAPEPTQPVAEPTPAPEPQPEPAPEPAPEPVPATEPAPPPPPPPAPAPQPSYHHWSPVGWTLLGERVAHGRHGHTVISVGKKKGSFTRLMLVVDGPALDVDSAVVTFANGQTFAAPIKQHFANSDHTRGIDLPGEARSIRRVDLQLGKPPGAGHVKVQVWAKGAPAPAPSHVTAAHWDRRGWTLVGEKWLGPHASGGVIQVGRKQGSFTHVMLVVEDGDVEMRTLRVAFGSGQVFDPVIRQRFREDSRTRSIDLPGGHRYVKHVEFHGVTLPGSNRARIELWAKLGGPAAPPPPPGGAHWQSAGWSKIGESWVDGRRDVDTIPIGSRGKFRRLTVVVERSELEMSSIKVTFGNGAVYQPPVRQYFRANSRTRVIDLPGNARRLQSIQFHYANLPGGGRALISVFAR